MNNHERQQQRKIVGWLRDVSPSDLVGDLTVGDDITRLRHCLMVLVLSETIGQVLPQGGHEQERKRVSRLARALAGVSFRAMAEEEGVAIHSISATIRDTILRIRPILDQY